MDEPSTPALVRITRAMRRDRVTPEGDRARRRLAAVGRGVHLGLDTVPGVVLVDMLEHGIGDVGMLPGTVVALVYGGNATAVCSAVENSRPAHVNAIAVSLRATRWHRLRAWWRYIRAELLGDWPARIDEIRGTTSRKRRRAK